MRFVEQGGYDLSLSIKISLILPVIEHKLLTSVVEAQWVMMRKCSTYTRVTLAFSNCPNRWF